MLQFLTCQISVMTFSNGKGDDSDRTAPKLTFISVRVKWGPSVNFFGEVSTKCQIWSQV